MSAGNSFFRRFCAVLVGLVFFAAGLVKLQDPVGSGLIVKEYFKLFHLEFLSFASVGVGTALALLECVCGAALIAGVWRRFFALVTSVMLLGFTGITVFLVITNPEMDCGCFGEAIHLTHFQTLIKNLILCVFALAAFLPVSRIGTVCGRYKEIAFALVTVGLLAFAVYSLRHLPLVDFTAFKPGAELRQASSGSDTEAYIYEKDGSSGVFLEGNLPDSTWTFTGMSDSPLDLADYSDSVVDLPIVSAEGEYCDELLCQGSAAVFSSYAPEKLDMKQWMELSSRIEDAYAAGLEPFLLVTSAENVPFDIQEYAFTADRKTLMTLNRSNGGVTYFNDGEIIRKWDSSSVPSVEEWMKVLSKDPSEAMLDHARKGRVAFEAFGLYSLVLLLAL